MRTICWIALLSIGTAPCIAQEPGQLFAPPPLAPANFRQCKDDFDSIWRTHNVVKDKLRVFDAAIQDYRSAQKALKSDHIWLGLVPADGQLAREGAAYLQAVSTTSSVLLKEMDRWDLLKSASEGLVTIENVYRALKQGKDINSLLKATSFSEELYRVALYLKGKGLPTEVRMALTVGEDFHKAIENDRAWQDYHIQVDRNMAQLDAYIASAKQQIKHEEDRLYASAKEGFEKFCAEAVPPRAEPDQYSLNTRQIGEFPVMANDRDPDGGSIRLVSVRAGVGSTFLGSVAVKSATAGTVRYEAPESPGIYQFIYSITDDESESAEALVTIHVLDAAVNSGPSVAEKSADDLDKELNALVESQLASFDEQWDRSMNDRAVRLERALQQAKSASRDQGRAGLTDFLGQVTALYNVATNGRNASALECAEKLMAGQVNASCSAWAQEEMASAGSSSRRRQPAASASQSSSGEGAAKPYDQRPLDCVSTPGHTCGAK